MSRSNFGWWGAELDRAAFAQALAAYGVLDAHGETFFAPKDLETWKKELAEALKDGEVTPWKLSDEPEMLMRYMTPPNASQLSQVWDQANLHPRLEIQPDTIGQSMLPWIIEQLSHPDVRAKSVYLGIEPRWELLQWDWPLRVGVLNEADRHQLEDELAKHSWGRRLCNIEVVGSGTGLSDVLILPLSLRQGLGELLQRAPEARAACVLLPGGVDEPWERAQPLVQAVLSQANASGAYFAQAPAQGWAAWFTDVLFELSHNWPLDVALYKTASRSSGAVPLLFASRELITTARVSAVLGDLIERLRSLPQAIPIQVPPAMYDNAMVQSDIKSLPAGELADKLQAANRDISYSHESEMASVAAELRSDVRQLAPTIPGTPRWIQGQVFELRAEGDPRRAERALRAGARHMLVVRIGPTDKEWLSPPKDGIFPDYELERDVAKHELRVVFSEPNHAPEPQTATILLPREGASSTCQFLFQTRSDVPTFRGRVIVLHRNRVLQTALLEGQVVSNPAEDAVAEPLRLGIEGLIRPVLEGLGARPDFALAFVTNHTPEKSSAVTAISGELATFRPLIGLDEKRREIVDLLKKLADTPDDYPKDLRHKNNVGLLWSLAFLGNALYRGIVPSQISPGRLKKSPRIQLVSASHDYLPLEFFYDLPVPKIGAGLCPNAERALRGECTECVDECTECVELKAVSGVGAEVICPFGFWCMRLVIERQAIKADQCLELQGAPFGLRCAPRPGAEELRVLRSAILAASEKVDAKREGTTQQLLDKLKNATVQNVVQVDTWKDWLKAVKDNAPSLLVLLPHTSKVHLTDMDWPQLEIGHGEALIEAYITRKQGEKSEFLTPDARAPAVFLLGCETLAPDVGVGDFTVAFQDGGAAIVLSTLTPVLGRDVGPVAEVLIKHLKETVEKKTAVDDKTFGCVMRALRRQALAQGNLMILCLVAHGDADWRLAPA